MPNKIYKKVKENKILSTIIGFVGALILSGLGSGIWEVILKPLFYKVGFLFVQLISQVFDGYKDSLYREASSGFHEFSSLSIMILVVFVVIAAYARLMSNHPHNKKKEFEWEKKFKLFLKSKKGYYVTCCISVSAIVFMNVFIFRISYVNQVITISERSINIVNPYLSEKDRLLLRAEFSSIESADDFYKFKSHVESVAEKNELKLPELNVL